MQFRPLLSSASGSPCVAMTRLSLTATVTPQPVPQNRHGALLHLTLESPPALWLKAGMAIPAAEPAAAAADCLMNSRLSIGDFLVHRIHAVGALVDKCRRQHTVDALNG